MSEWNRVEETSNDRELYNLMQLKIQEAQEVRTLFEGQWQENIKLLLGDHKEVFKPGGEYFVANHIRQIHDANVAVMTENPPRLAYMPNETGEAADYFLKDSSMWKLEEARNQGLDPSQYEEGQLEGMVRMSEDQAQNMMAQFEVENTQEIQDEEGNVQNITYKIPLFGRDDFHIIDAQTESDIIEQEVSTQSNQFANFKQVVTDNISNMNCIGHCNFLVQWDAQNEHFLIQNVYAYNEWIDPWASNVWDAEYYIVKEFMESEKARAYFPEHKDFIDRKESMAGTTTGFATIGAKENRVSNKKGVNVHTWWYRNHPYDVEVEEALEKGLVQPALEEVEVGVVDEFGNPVMDEGHQMMELQEQPMFDEETGEPLYVNQEGQATVPGDESWPKRSGIRQIQFLEDMKVFDGESAFVDIPSARSKCMLIPESPYAQGEPQRVAQLTDLKNRLMSMYMGYVKRFRAPEQIMPKEVYEESKEAAKSIHKDFNKIWLLSEDTLARYGGDIRNVFQTIEPPTAPGAIAQVIELVTREINMISGMSDVLRGETKSDQSGELFRQALEAARGPIGLKARNVAEALTHVSKIVAHLIANYLSPEVASQRNRKYPPQVYARVFERIRDHGVNPMADVSGSGSRDEKIRNLREIMSEGIVTPTLLKNRLEKMGVADYHKIIEEWKQMQGISP